jgi:RNA polymerase sigma-70 factor (ECF subfamily)
VSQELQAERAVNAEGMSNEVCAGDRTRDSADLELLHRMACGDERAVSQLYDAHSPRLFGLAHAIVRERADAEEVVVDAFAKAWHDAARFDAARGSVVGWLTTIVRSRALDLVRARTRRARAHERAGVHAAVDADLDAKGSAARSFATPAMDAEVLSTELARALRTLPDAQRQVVELAFFKGASHSRIAEQLGLPLGTVKTRARMALRTMRAALVVPPRM